MIPPSSASSSIGVSKPSNCLQMSVGSLTVDLGQVSPKEARFPSITETQMGRNLWRPLSSLLQSTTIASSTAGCLCPPKTFKVLETSPDRDPPPPQWCVAGLNHPFAEEVLFHIQSESLKLQPVAIVPHTTGVSMELFTLPGSKETAWHPITPLRPCSAPESIKISASCRLHSALESQTTVLVLHFHSQPSFPLLSHFCFSLTSPDQAFTFPDNPMRVQSMCQPSISAQSWNYGKRLVPLIGKCSKVIL